MNKLFFVRYGRNLAALLLACVLLLARYFLPERSLDTLGWQAWWDLLFALLLLCLVIFSAYHIGRKVLSWKGFSETIRPDQIPSGELILFSLAVGLGFLATGIFLLAVIGAIKGCILGLALFNPGVLGQLDISTNFRFVDNVWGYKKETG